MYCKAREIKFNSIYIGPDYIIDAYNKRATTTHSVVRLELHVTYLHIGLGGLMERLQIHIIYYCYPLARFC